MDMNFNIAAAYAAQTEFLAARQYEGESDDRVFELTADGVIDACGTCLQLGRFCPSHMHEDAQGVRELAVA